MTFSTPGRSGLMVVLFDCDDSRRGRVRELVNQVSGLRIVGEARTGRELVGLIARMQPELVVALLPLDDRSPTLMHIAAAAGNASVLLVSDSRGHDSCAPAENVQCLDVAEVDSHLVSRLRELAHHGSSGSARIAPKAFARAQRGRHFMKPSTPSPRQLEVLRHLAEGLSHRAIAEALGIAQSTVDKHVADLYVRLHVASREQALSRAAQLGWAVFWDASDASTTEGDSRGTP